MNKILGFVMLGSKDFKESSKFYDAIFKPLKIKRVVITENYVGYGHLDEPNEVKFYLCKPRNGEPATYGNGSMIAFLAESKDAVNQFYKIALDNGAVDEGAPGIRADGDYYAYIRDLDRNKIAVKFISG